MSVMPCPPGAGLFLCKEIGKYDMSDKSEVTFDSLGLHPDLLHALATLGYEKPTPIQERAIPLLLQGLDILGQAQTGTGKTAAFALPMLHNLPLNHSGVEGLVVAPTRELALQVARAIAGYGASRGVRVATVYGGQSYKIQISALRRGADIVVGTPGRMLDLIEKKLLDLSEVRVLVLDEADEMLSMGFIEDIETILSSTPVERQTALFSATMSREVKSLAERYMQTPQSVTINPETLTVDNIEQRYYVVRGHEKQAALARILEMDNVSSALVFARTRVGCAELAESLLTRGTMAEALHGDLSQDVRETVLGRFRRGSVSVLVATDVAARGLDIDDVSHVINFDLPYDSEYYVHRIGRTGRAGKKGVALTLVTPDEHWRIRKLERYTGAPMHFRTLPTVNEIEQHREDLFIDTLADQVADEDLTAERILVRKLVHAGMDPVDIAAAAMQLARDEEKQRPLDNIRIITEKPSRGDNKRGDRRGGGKRYGKKRGGKSGGGKHEAGMTRLILDAGHSQQLRPRDVVGAIASRANIPGKSVGAIDIQDGQTYVDVKEKHVDKVLHVLRDWKVRGKRVDLRKA